MPSNNRRPRVFLSYSQADRKTAIDLEGRLKKLGHSIFRDAHSITAGTRWFDAIQNAIRNARAVVVLISKSSLKSEWVAYEYAFAIGAQVPIVAITLDEAKVPAPIRNFHWVKYSNSKEAADQTSRGIRTEAARLSEVLASTPTLVACFKEYSGKLHRLREELDMELWIEGAPAKTREVRFEILDHEVDDRRWSVRRSRKRGSNIRAFLTDELSLWGNVEIWAKGISSSGTEWSSTSTLYKALRHYYRGRKVSAEIKKGLKQIRDW